MKVQADRLNDPIRTLVMERMAALNMSRAKVSLAVGRGRSFMQDYLTRGCPHQIPDEIRTPLAKVLDLDDFVLCYPGQRALDGRVAQHPYSSTVANDEVPRAAFHSVIADVPCFAETDLIEPERATMRAPRPSNVAIIGGMFAIVVTTGCSRTRPGDIVYVATRPPRTGDIAVCLKDNRVTAIGELAHLTGDTARMVMGTSMRDVSFDRILKVTTVATA